MEVFLGIIIIGGILALAQWLFTTLFMREIDVWENCQLLGGEKYFSSCAAVRPGEVIYDFAWDRIGAVLVIVLIAIAIRRNQKNTSIPKG